MTFWLGVLKWLPYILQVIGTVATMVGAHNHVAFQAGAQGNTLMGTPLLGAGILASVAALGGHIRNNRAAQAELPASPPGGVTSEKKLLGLLAQQFAENSDMRLTQIMDLYAKKQQ